MTLIEASKVAITAGLAATQTTPPLVSVSPELALACVVVVAFLSVVSSQMPSWQASPEVAKAATAAEKP